MAKKKYEERAKPLTSHEGYLTITIVSIATRYQSLATRSPPIKNQVFFRPPANHNRNLKHKFKPYNIYKYSLLPYFFAMWNSGVYFAIYFSFINVDTSFWMSGQEWSSLGSLCESTLILWIYSLLRLLWLSLC